MYKIVIFAVLLSLISLISGSCGDETRIGLPQVQDTVAVEFQDGVHPDPFYIGTRDAVLRDGPSWEFRNGNFGQLDRDTLGAVFLADSYFERRMILRMALSTTDNFVSVIDDSLFLSVEPGYADSLSLEAYEVTVPDGFTESWPEGSGGTGNGVSWYAVDGQMPWKNEGGDYLAPLLYSVTVKADSIVAFSLPKEVIAKWITDPGQNNGVLIKIGAITGEHFRIVHMRESSTPTLRPRLWIQYVRSI